MSLLLEDGRPVDVSGRLEKEIRKRYGIDE